MIQLCQYWYRFALMLLLFRIRVYIKPQPMLYLELVKYNKCSDSVIQGKLSCFRKKSPVPAVYDIDNFKNCALTIECRGR